LQSKNKTTLSYVVIVVLFFVLFVQVYSELPPSAYKSMQDNAPEQSIFKVSTVKIDTVEQKGDNVFTRFEEKITVTCKIVKVLKTASKLKKNTKIQLGYSRYIHDPNSTFVGPSAIPILEIGTSYTGYFRSLANGTYLPTAGSHSFIEQIKPTSKKQKKLIK